MGRAEAETFLNDDVFKERQLRSSPGCCSKGILRLLLLAS